MEIVPTEILTVAKDLINSLGGLDNISRITAGRTALLTIALHHVEYIKETRLKLIPCIKEFLISDSSITLVISGLPVHELEMAIRLSEAEERKGQEEGEDEFPGLHRLFAFLQAAFTPVLSAILAGGFLQVLLISLIALGIVSAEWMDGTRAATISGGIYYVLPVLVALSLARHYRTNAYIAVAIAGILNHPEVTALITGPVLRDFFGIGLFSHTYPNSILPILLIVPFQAKVDRYLSAYFKDSANFFIKPFLLLAQGMLLGILLLGPVMDLIGNATLAGIQYLNTIAPWLATMTLAAVGPIFVLFGAHYPLIPFINNDLTILGYDAILGPSFLAMNMANAGVALAVTVKTRKHNWRAYGGVSTLLALMGVSQPTLYGIELPLQTPFFHAIIGGAIGGLYAGIMKVKAFALLNPSILSLAFFRDTARGMNLVHVGVTMALSFLVSFLLTWRSVLYEPTDEEMRRALAEEDREELPYS